MLLLCCLCLYHYQGGVKPWEECTGVDYDFKWIDNTLRLWKLIWQNLQAIFQPKTSIPGIPRTLKQHPKALRYPNKPIKTSNLSAQTLLQSESNFETIHQQQTMLEQKKFHCRHNQAKSISVPLKKCKSQSNNFISSVKNFFCHPFIPPLYYAFPVAWLSLLLNTDGWKRLLMHHLNVSVSLPPQFFLYQSHIKWLLRCWCCASTFVIIDVIAQCWYRLEINEVEILKSPIVE